MTKFKLLVLCSTLTLSISSFAYDFQSGDLYYNITSSTPPYTVEVTSRYNSYPYNISGLSTAVIPNVVSYNGETYTVSSIGSKAFYLCESLTSVTIPTSVINIGSSAFYQAGLTSVTIPDSITRICEATFAHCLDLQSVNLPQSVVSIDNSAFYNCVNLKSFTIPSNLKSLGAFAFVGTGFTSVTLPESLIDIAPYAFQNMGLTSVTLPQSATSIGEGLFSYCANLTSVTIPQGIVNIDFGAFEDCSNLETLVLPSSLQKIGDNGFAGCSKLTYIMVNAAVPPIIESNTFYNVNLAIPLYVPVGTVGLYKSTIYWKKFGNIQEAPITAIKLVSKIEGVYAQNGNIVVENDTNVPIVIYDVVGRLVTSGLSSTHSFAVPNAGVYIVSIGAQTLKVLVP